MRKALERVLFYTFYFLSAVAVVAAFNPAVCMGTCLLLDAVFVAYAWARYSDSQMLHRMRKFIYGCLLAAMVCGGFLAHNAIPLIYLGPVFVGYLRLEGGFRYVEVS